MSIAITKNIHKKNPRKNKNILASILNKKKKETSSSIETIAKEQIFLETVSNDCTINLFESDLEPNFFTDFFKKIYRENEPKKEFSDAESLTSNEKKPQYFIPENFLQDSKIKPIMRATLFDWIFEISAKLKLKRDTIYVCFYYIDKYLSLNENILPKNLQLIGISSLHIACKKEVIILIKQINNYN